MLNKLTIKILGLEADLFESISATEQQLYRFVAFCFLSNLILSMVATTTFMWIVSYSYVISLVGGLVLSFTISNMIRFAWLNFVRPLQFQQEHHNQSISMHQKGTYSMDFESINLRLTKFKYYLKKNNPIGLGTLLRVFIFTVLLQLIVFPWMTLIHWQKTSELTEKYRTQLLQQFDIDKRKSFNLMLDRKTSELIVLSQKLINVSTTSNSNSRLFRNLSNQKSRLQNEIVDLRANFELSNQDQLIRYSKKLERRYFPIITFKSIATLPDLLIWELVFGALIFMPFYLMKRLNDHEQFQYAEKCQIRYRSVVFNDYDRTKNFIESKLNKLGVKSKYDAIWEDPPFYTRYKNAPSKKQLIPINLLPLGVINNKK